MNDIAVPKSERVWLTHYNANHDPDYVITSKVKLCSAEDRPSSGW